MQRQNIHESTLLRVARIELDANEQGPMHKHSEAREQILCLEGLLGVELENRRHSLASGEQMTIAPDQHHRVFNASDQACAYLLSQFGHHDFIIEHKDGE